MRHGLTLAAALLLAAAPAAAQDAAQIDAFIAAVTDAGCLIANDTQAAAVEAATGFDDATLGSIVGVLVQDGRLVFTEDGIRLVAGSCQ